MCKYLVLSPMSATPAHPTLRLVNPDGAAMPRPSPPRNAALRPADGSAARRLGPDTGLDAALRLSEARQAEARVARANQESVALSALDPRWILAVAASREVQSGRAAVLTPESRRRLVSTGSRLGLRAFDANLVIAIVQDAARTGADPLAGDVVARLQLVGADPELADARPGFTWRQLIIWMFAAAAAGSALTLVLTRLLG